MRVPLIPAEGKLALQQSNGSEATLLATNQARFDLYPIKQFTGHSLLVKVQPPKEPTHHIHHVPCEIVLVIDVSGSMSEEAPLVGEGSTESTGLSVLDLVKHAALTIVETMDERDQLGIVEFANKAEVVQPLTVMTDSNKDAARAKIRGLQTKGATNLWHGILEATKLFAKPQPAERVPAIMVLTDGVPNHMCPNAGYVPKLRSMMPLPASIHTFGFGYHLRSGLLKSIAEIGSGNFAFIPDAGMIGTVFVHAVANLQATYATNATLTIQYDDSVTVREVAGESVVRQSPEFDVTNGRAVKRLAIPLGNIQYGQSRDIFLGIENIPNNRDLTQIEARIDFKPVDVTWSGNSAMAQLETSCNILDEQTIPVADVAYHESRSLVCNFLAETAPLDDVGEHKPRHSAEHLKMQRGLRELIRTLPAKRQLDPLNKSLMEDLDGPSPKGQVALALQKQEYYRRWGQHFYLSLSNAYTRQICNSFKDSGPLQFGAHSPLFIACRDRLDNAFDNLPPPEPSIKLEHRRGYVHGRSSHSSVPLSMASYRNAAGPCFAGSTMVELASGRSVEIKRLRRGMKLRTPIGTRKVAALVKTIVHDMVICRIGNVLVTPWHPISTDGKSWAFPAYLADGPVRYTGAIYSVILQRDANPDAHAMRLDGVWGVTLGHGITSGADVRSHSFLGDYNLVGKSIVRLGVDSRGLALSSGVQRHTASGLIMGFSSVKNTLATRYSKSLRVEP